MSVMGCTNYKPTLRRLSYESTLRRRSSAPARSSAPTLRRPSLARTLIACSLSLFTLVAYARPTALRKVLVQAATNTTLRSIEISLQEKQQSELAAWVSALPTVSGDLPGDSLEDLARSIGRHLRDELTRAKRSEHHGAMQRALERSANYLGLDERLLAQRVSSEHIPFPVKPVLLTRNIDDLTSIVQSASWPEIDAYTADRLGPLRAILALLSPRDQVLLTNLRGLAALALIPDLVSATRYQLPLSSYGKQIIFTLRRDGSRTLILSNFDTRAYLLHFGLLVSRFRYAQRLQFTIAEHVDPASLETSYGQLLDFAKTEPSLFSSLDAIVVGYTSAFHSAWSRYLVAEAHQLGLPYENWALNVYRFPEGSVIGVLGGDVDFYGEGLAEQLERLHRRFPLKQIFFGGSGGAMTALAPYEMYFPSAVMSPDGHKSDNVLTGSLDAGCHVSVDSPLLETPSLLSDFQRRRFNTVDMEAGHLASFASRCGIELGVGILVTDFPCGFRSLSTFLGSQDFGAKRRARGDFVRIVESYVRKGQPTHLHHLERWTKKTIFALSLETLHRHRDEIGVFSAEEQEVVARLFSLPFRITVRMSPGRLHWMLTDGALFSTQLVNSLGNTTDPYTPKLEDDMFGAFDYVFAEYSTAYGHPRYGDVAVVLKTNEVLPRCWGSRASGWRVAGYNRGASLEVHKRNFLREVLHPDHFRETMALQAVYRWRRLNDTERSALLDVPTETWPPLLYEAGFGKLELKLKTSVLLREVERVRLPRSARGDIPSLLRSRAIPFEYFSPR